MVTVITVCHCWDQQIADVWSCGVTLYVMLVGAYPFEDAEDPKNFRTTITVINLTDFWTVTDTSVCVWMCVTRLCPWRFLITLLNVYNTWNGQWQRILSVQYSFPDYVRISMECIHLLSRIFVADPEKVWLLSLTFSFLLPKFDPRIRFFIASSDFLLCRE